MDMGKKDKLLRKILSGTSDKNIEFTELLSRLEFTCRIKGSHHILFKNGVEEIINIQPKKSLAKPYQIKQIRNIILKYKLSLT